MHVLREELISRAMRHTCFPAVASAIGACAVSAIPEYGKCSSKYCRLYARPSASAPRLRHHRSRVLAELCPRARRGLFGGWRNGEMVRLRLRRVAVGKVQVCADGVLPRGHMRAFRCCTSAACVASPLVAEGRGYILALAMWRRMGVRAVAGCASVGDPSSRRGSTMCMFSLSVRCTLVASS